MAGETIQITSREGKSFDAYVARPAKTGPAPGIVLIQEMLGLTSWLKGMADRLAAGGFIVAAPDVFWRVQPGFVGDHANKADYDRAWAYLRTLDYDLATEDVGATVAALRARADCNGKVAAVGFCMGGTLAYLASTRLPVDAAVAYYGTGIHNYVNEGSKIACPLMMHMGDKDHTLKPDDVHEIFAALIGIPHVSVWRYDAGHAFANSDVPSLYAREHAEKAHERTFKLLEQLK